MKKEEKQKLKKIYIILAIIVFLIIFIDQLSKILIIHYDEISLLENKIILKPVETQNEIYNENSKSVNIITNIVIVGIIFGIIKSDNQFITKKTRILLTFAFAGGVSNIIDKIFRGEIVEFINIEKFPAFNIADICILIGWISFVAIFASFTAKELSKRKNPKKNEKEDNEKKINS